MRDPEFFVLWITVLRNLQVNFDEFIEEEFETGRWVDRGWTKETFLDNFWLLKFEDTRPLTLSRNCKLQCEDFFNVFGNVGGRKEWDVVVAMVKQGQRIITWDENKSLCESCRLCSPHTRWTPPDHLTLLADAVGEPLLEPGECSCHIYENYWRIQGYERPCGQCNWRLGWTLDYDCRERRDECEAKKNTLKQSTMQEISIPGGFEPVFM
jgi:hypothetical protein